MNQKELLVDNTIYCILKESTTSTQLFNDIVYIKKLLGEFINKDNYINMPVKQLKAVYNSYKDRYNKSGIIKYKIYIIVYNTVTHSSMYGWLSEQDDITRDKLNFKIFDSYEDASKAFDYYVNNYIDTSTHQLIDGSGVQKIKI